MARTLYLREHADGWTASTSNGRLVVWNPTDLDTVRARVARWARWEAREGRPVPSEVVVEPR